VNAVPIPTFDPFVGWNEPDPRLVNGGARPAPALPLRAFGPMASYVSDLAAAKGAPPDYVAISLLCAAAGVVGLSRAVEVKPGWTEPCILWGVLVGVPSSGKSQPLDVMRRAARSIEVGEGSDFAEVEREWKATATLAEETEDEWTRKVREAVKAGLKPPPRPVGADVPPEPQRPRIIVGNATPEKLNKLFAANPRGLLLMMDEGAGWFGNFGKYGGDGDAAFYLSAYNDIPMTVDRVKEGGSVTPEHSLLSACVGIQPERFNDLLLRRRPDDGFVPRLLPAWPDPVALVWNTPRVDESRIEVVLQRLRGLAPAREADGRLSSVIRTLDPAAEALFSEWWLEITRKAQASSGFQGGFLGKGPGVVARLALVIELLTWAWVQGPEPEAVSATSVAAAVTLFEDYFAPMAARVYGDATRPPAERAATALLKAIRVRQARSINARDVYRNWCLPGLSTSEATKAALDVLVEGDCIREVRKSGSGGRPPADFEVNPYLLEVAS
jgi:hypothetical protein